MSNNVGDVGITKRLTGCCIAKDDIVAEVNGSIDELSSFLGIVRRYSEEQLDSVIKLIQYHLVIAGAEVSGVVTESKTKIETGDIEFLDTMIEALQSELDPIDGFIIPGSCTSSAYAHIARTQCRLIERRLVTLNRTETVRDILLQYFNKLSSALFTLSRYNTKKAGLKDEVWSQKLT